MPAYRHGRRRGHWIAAALLAASQAALAAAPPDLTKAATAPDLGKMSLEELGDIDITSVSKRAEPLSDAAAAVYVISHDDIIRSGAMTLGEMLRLAPNLQVAQASASSYVITARGFNGNAADKLLVLIDGRSVYTPLFGGVYWDVQDVPPENIERIEVISGPGATLWGANAVNGVINIITRKAVDTPGGVLDLAVGNRATQDTVQYGGRISQDLNYRVYLGEFAARGGKLSDGTEAHDAWSRPQAGFRVDWTPDGDTMTVQGDAYHGSEQAPGLPDGTIAGGNFQVTWQHRLADGSEIRVQSYYDATRRFASNGDGYALNTYDFEAQHSLAIGSWNNLVWGVGLRVWQDRFSNVGPVIYLPVRTTETLADIFAQDSIALTPTLTLTLGMKFEEDPHAGVSPLPTLRLGWKPVEQLLLWSAVSRAVRAPTRFDTDLIDNIIPSVLVLTGNRDFLPEKLTAYEVGIRTQPTPSTSFSISGYYNVYDDLRSIEWVQMNALPLIWTYGNLMEGETYGVEIWGDWHVTERWKLSAGLNLEHEHLHFKPGASQLGGTASAGDDPDHQAILRSSLDLTHGVTWDADLRVVGSLPNPAIPGYSELDTRLAWQVDQRLELALVGLNLLHPRHLEYEQAGATVGGEVYRSFYVGARWRF